MNKLSEKLKIRCSSIRKERKSGFTLVELAVVLLLIGILIGLAVFGIGNYITAAEFRKQNENAQTIFVAAQTQLTQYGERGQLTALRDIITDGGKAKPEEYKVSSKGINPEWQEDKDGNARKGDVYYLRAEKGDYDWYLKYKKGEKTASSAKERRLAALFDMLDPFVADKSVFDAAFCVEFDPDPKVALVYSVFYNEKVDALRYEGESLTGDDSKKIARITDRSEPERRKDQTGYYGADILSRGTDTFESKPIISDVRLNNAETLNLSWKVNSADALIGLIYNIKIFKAPESADAEGALIGSLSFGTVDKDLQTGKYLLRADYTKVISGGNAESAEMYFPVEVSPEDQSITLVLDALDLGADETMSYGDSTTGNENKMKHTASIGRLGLDAENIYCSISGSHAGVYKLTMEKKSNTEHMMLGGLTTDSAGTKRYTVANARHLSNLRYIEKKNSAADTIYSVNADIDWEATVNGGWVYDTDAAAGEPKLVDPKAAGFDIKTCYFKPISRLGSKSTIRSDESGKTRVLGNFHMSSSRLPVFENDFVPKLSTGLFVVNEGVIRNLTMNQVTVSGEEYNPAAASGSFAAVNRGTMEQLLVQGDASRISGGYHVGGIMGIAEGKVSADSLVNRAPVTGFRYVGGIAGKAQADSGQTMSFEKCENYGSVRGRAVANPAGGNELEAFYLGGITGYSAQKAGGSLTLSNCTSSPSYTDVETLLEHLSAETPDFSELQGIFVGGITGYNENARIESCSTLKEAGGAAGYVIGKDYVGGIMGFNSGTNAAGSESVTGQNQTNVIGRSYVGGIVGCNAALDTAQGTGGIDEENGKVYIKEGPAPEIVIRNWLNEGMVLGFGDYVGGITGKNYGTIKNCNSDVNYTEDIRKIAELATDTRYAGGIAGYNRGTIDSEQLMQTNSVIRGKYYVGGIVGYNDVGGNISNYALSGGYVFGKRFVGGFVGLNADKAVFENAGSPVNIESNPNEVRGDYFVGGIIGANLMPASGDVRVVFRADNFLGSLNAEAGAFAGGFIGYNYLLKADTASSDIQAAADNLCNAAMNLQTIEEPLKNTLREHANTTTTMMISGEESVNTEAKFEGIRAKVYAGGVVGYNQESTKLEIRNVENITTVEASDYIIRRESGTEEAAAYSYVGGIIGRVSENVSIINCRNYDVGGVKTKGTYTGGLAEINLGLIKDCTSSSLGDGTAGHIGGIVGINVSGNSEGTKGIVNCTATGTMMGGANLGGDCYIGGITAENYGYIINPTVTKLEIEASGRYVGGVTGYAHKGSHITFSGSNHEIDVNIDGGGEYVGALAGVNEGTFAFSGTSGNYIENKKENSISGKRYVGGFIGEQKAESRLSHMRNRAEVQAEEGYVGGIVAKVSHAKAVIADCENIGEVEVLAEPTESPLEEDINASLAGGITAANRGVIENCVDLAGVRAASGYSGGITAVNYGTISGCRVGNPQNSSTSTETLTFVGNRFVGGVAAYNMKDKESDAALIKDTAVVNALLQNQSVLTDAGSSDIAGAMGGIVGYNGGHINNCAVGVYPEDDGKLSERYAEVHEQAAQSVAEAVQAAGANVRTDTAFTLLNSSGNPRGNSVILTAYASDTMAGGVAGFNEGAIAGTGTVNEPSVVAAELRFAETNMNYYGYLGGIAGVNQGNISKYEFNGFIHGTANNPSRTPEYDPNYDYEPKGIPVYGYGGIVGLNGDDKTAKGGSIADCALSAVRVGGIGDANNRTNIGGVAGVNGKNAVIAGTRFLETVEDASYSYQATGNNGKESKAGSVWVGTSTDGYGHIGGVAGFNYGTVSGTNRTQKYIDNRDKYFAEGEVADPVLTPLSEVDESSVLVVAGAGHVGGIVGYNRQTGVLEQNVTGPNWHVQAEKHGQDNAAGGIIGYNVSYRDIVSCDNHASVYKYVGSSNSVGGMVGRSEIATSSSWRIYDCRNYGHIAGTGRVAGMIGQIKYRGGTLENCKNYGRVDAKEGGAGGMIAYLYVMPGDEKLYLTGCENHGLIYAPGAPAGGLVGGNNGTDIKVHIYLSRCVNTGLISGSSQVSGGLVGSTVSAVPVTFNRCHNYGYSYGANTGFGGMYGKIEADKTLTECFSVTDPGEMYPISNGSKNGYYFESGSDPTLPGSFWVKSVATEGEWDSKTQTNLWHVVDGSTTSDNAYVASSSSAKKAKEVFRFNQPVTLKELRLDWLRNNDHRRAYTYTVEYLDEDGDWVPAGTVAESQDDIQAVKTSQAIFSFQDLLGESVTTEAVRLTYYVHKSNGNTNAALAEFTAVGTVEGGSNVTSSIKAADGDGETSLSGGVYTYTRNVSPNPNPDDGNTGKKAIPLYLSEEGTSAGNIGRSEAVDLGRAYTIEELWQSSNGDRHNNSKASYQLFTELDPHLVLKREIGSLRRPVISKATAAEGAYFVEWDSVTQAQYYEVELQYTVKNPDTGAVENLGPVHTYTLYTNGLSVPSAYSHEIGGTMKTADGFTLKLKAIAETGSGERVESDWSELYTKDIAVILPTPQIRWELERLFNGGSQASECYRIILENQAEYAEFAAEHGLALENIQITAVRGSTYTFTADKAGLLNEDGSYRLIGGNGTNNVRFTSYAELKKGTSGADPSLRAVRESMLPKAENYNKKGTDSGSTDWMSYVRLEKKYGSRANEIDNKIGFSGTNADTLSYNVAFRYRTDQWVPYFRTDFVADDPELHVPVALTYSEMLVSTTNPDYSYIALTGLPSDFLEKKDDGYLYENVMVRSYPSMMSNNIVFQGHQVKAANGEDAAFTAEELKACRVTEDGNLSDDGDLLIDGGELIPGYVVERRGEDNYTLYYNALLYETERQTSPYDEDDDLRCYSGSNTYMKYQVFYHKIDLETEIAQLQPEPVLYVNAVYDDTAAASGWGDGEYQKAETFTLTWDQDAANGKPAYYQGLPSEYGADSAYTLTIEAALPDGRTTILENKKRLTKGNAVPYNIYERADAGSWNYRSLKVTLTREGTLNDKGMTEKFPTTVERTFALKTRLSTIGEPVITLTKKNGVVQKDGLNYTVSWTPLGGDELSALEHYEVRVKKVGGTDSDVIIKTADRDGSSVDLDLNQFSQGEQLEVSVRAIAKADSTYRDSLNGTVKKITLPKPLFPPEMGAPDIASPSNANMTADNVSGETPTKDEFENDGCVRLHMKDAVGSYSGNGRYQIAIKLFKTEEDAKADVNAIENVALPEKSDDNRTYMTGNLKNADYILNGLSAEYAGYYIRVILRSVSDSSISSVWTEDDADNPDIDYTKVTDCRVFKLPNVRVDSMNYEKGTEQITYPILQNGVEVSGLQLTATQKTISFAETEYAGSYRVQMVQTPQTAERTATPSNADMKVSDFNEMTFEKQTDGSWTVTYDSTEQVDIDGSGENVVRKPGAVTIAIPARGTAAEVEIPYQKEAVIARDGEEIFTIRPKAYLQAVKQADGAMSFVLTLPDYLELVDAGGNPVDPLNFEYYTEQLLFHAQAQEGSNYTDSEWIATILDELTGEFSDPVNLGEMNTESEMPTMGSSLFEASEISGIAFEKNGITAASRYLVRVTANGKDCGVFGMPYTSAGTERNHSVWLPDGFARFAGKNVTLQFRSIIENGGLGEWTSETYSETLPELPAEASVDLVQGLSVQQNYRITDAAENLTRSRRTASAELKLRQSEVTWLYPVSSTKVNGYDLRLEREGGAEYRLKVDLTRNRYGQFNGLREYLTPEGKLLYKVAYDAEGDIIPYDEPHEEPEEIPENIPVASGSNAEPESTEQDVPIATPSNSEASGSGSNVGADVDIYIDPDNGNAVVTASPSNSDTVGTPPSGAPTQEALETTVQGVLYLECRLRAEPVYADETLVGIRFILTLPDVSVLNMEGGRVLQYENVYGMGMYSTVGVKVIPIMVNRYFLVPKQEWFYLEDDIIEDDREDVIE